MKLFKGKVAVVTGGGLSATVCDPITSAGIEPA